MTLPTCVSLCANMHSALECDFDDPPESDDFDPLPLEDWILDDFDWDIEQPHPEQGDFSVDPDELFENEQDILAA